MRVDSARRRLDLGRRGVRPAEGDVLPDRAAEQERLLRHDAHLRAQRPHGDVAQVVAVDQHAALGRVVEARDQLRERRLAGAGLADQRHGLPGRHVQVDVGQGVAGAVGERDVLEGDVAADAVELDGVGAVAQLGLLVEQLEDLVERRHARLIGRVELRQRLDRVEEVVQRRHEGDQHPDRHLALDRLHPAVEQDPRGREGRQELDRREVRRVQVDRLHVRVVVVLVELIEALEVPRLLREGAHDADAGQRLLQVGGDGGDLLARLAVRVGGDDPEGERAEREHREDEEREQRELDVEHEQDHRRADQRQRRADQGDDAVGDELVERLHVVGQARDQDARLAARVEADRQLPGGGRRAGSAGPAAPAGRPSRPGRSARTWRPSTRAR